MTDISWIFISGFAGFILGKFGNTREEPVTKERDLAIEKYESKIQYYKKLTKSIVEENAELRKKLNDNH